MMPEPGDHRAPPPQSVLRVVRILEALCAGPEPATLADLSRALATPKSSLAALLRGLAEQRYVIAGEGSFRLGPEAFGLGSALVEAQRRRRSSELVRDGMRRLAELSGETVLLAVRDEDQPFITYVDVVESRKAVRFAVAAGDRRPCYCTAAGRALLAEETDEAVRRCLHRLKPERRTPATETERDALLDAVAAARADGVAQTVDQASEGVTGTAAVIRDASGTASGALVVAAPTSRLHDRLAELRDMVRAEAEVVSRSLGFRARAV